MTVGGKQIIDIAGAKVPETAISIVPSIQSDQSYNQLPNSKAFDPSTVKFINDVELDKLELPEMDWVVDGLIPQDGLTLLAGKQKSGKSFGLIQLAECVVRGLPFLNRATKKGDVLKKHIDRKSCAVSTTLNLGGDMWPIFLIANNKKIKVELKPGDMLIYKGCELEHWRDEFKGTKCIQTFLHYNEDKKNANKYDGRVHLGLPNWFKNRFKK